MSWNNRRNMVLRTIRNGKIRINGITFKPALHNHVTSIPYTGQLDGQRFAFGLYWGPPNYDRNDASGWNNKMVCLWGSEKAYKDGGDWPGANYINGYFQWEWWHAE